jgi:hypothetical protein
MGEYFIAFLFGTNFQGQAQVVTKNTVNRNLKIHDRFAQIQPPGMALSLLDAGETIWEHDFPLISLAALEHLCQKTACRHKTLEAGLLRFCTEGIIVRKLRGETIERGNQLPIRILEILATRRVVPNVISWAFPAACTQCSQTCNGLLKIKKITPKLLYQKKQIIRRTTPNVC